MWVFIALSAALVLGVASYSVLRVSKRLSHTEAQSVYDIQAAVDYVLSELPDKIQLEGYKVEFLLSSHMDYLRVSGIANQGRADLVAVEMAEKTPKPLADENETLDFVLAQLGETQLEIEIIDVVVVLDLSMQYLVSVGAVGSPIDSDS